MTGIEIVQEIVSILVSGISGVATGIGQGLSTMAQAIFMSGTGENQTISVFGVLIIAFAGVSLALGLCRLVYQLITSLGARNN